MLDMLRSQHNPWDAVALVIMHLRILSGCLQAAVFQSEFDRALLGTSRDHNNVHVAYLLRSGRPRRATSNSVILTEHETITTADTVGKIMTTFRLARRYVPDVINVCHNVRYATKTPLVVY